MMRRWIISLKTHFLDSQYWNNRSVVPLSLFF
jgi:hypothetical protein